MTTWTAPADVVHSPTDGDVTPDAAVVPAGPDGGEEQPGHPSLSPSRAADFKTCPLLYRFRTIDRLPERPSPDQARGTLVHAVLEKLFDLPPAERTPAAAAELVGPQWSRLVEECPEIATVLDVEAGREGAADDAVSAVLESGAGPESGAGSDATAAREDVAVGRDEAAARFLGSARGLVERYFGLEDPQRLQPAERESLVSTVIDDQLLIRGYVDRLDISPAGDLRVVDYKTGGAPREAFEARALFQLKFYALALWRTRGVVPRALRLVYLRDAEVCDYAPAADELERFERTVLALWQAIERAVAARDFRPRPSRLCAWCSHQSLCPAFGGTPPPYPEPSTAPEGGGAPGAASASNGVGPRVSASPPEG